MLVFVKSQGKRRLLVNSGKNEQWVEYSNKIGLSTVLIWISEKNRYIDIRR